MAFSGGGSNILKPHTHDSGIVQDGGNLDFKNITQSAMSAGSITFSDSNHLQELQIGNAGEELKVNAGATALEYFDTSAHGKWELLDQHAVNNASSETTYTKTFSPVLGMMDGGGYNALYCIGKGRATAAINLKCKINALTEWTTNYNQNAAGTLTGVNEALAPDGWNVVPTAIMAPAGVFPFSFGFYITGAFAAASGSDKDFNYYGFGCTNVGFASFHGQSVNTSDVDISSIQFYADSNAYTGTVFAIYGIKQ